MNQADVVPSVTLSHYMHVLRRRWWIVLVCTALGLLVALAYLSVVPRSASATASVALNVITTDPFNVNRAASGLIDSAGEAQAASSYAVAARAAAQLPGGVSPERVRSAVRVNGVADTAILQVTATGQSAEEARALANAVATEFLAFRSEQAQNRIARTLDQSNERLEQLRAELREVDQQIADADPDSVEETQAQSDRSLLALQINAVVSQAASTASIDTSGGTVLSPAEGNPVTWSPQQDLVAASGIAVGFGLGVIGAFAAGALSTRVRSGVDVGPHGGRTVLGVLPERRVTLPPSGEDLGHLRAIHERLWADPQLEGRAGILTVIDDSLVPSVASVSVALAVVVADGGTPVELVSPGMTAGDVDELASRLELRRDDQDPRTGMHYRSELVPSLTLFVPREADVALTETSVAGRPHLDVVTQDQRGLVVLALDRGSGEASRLAACRMADAVLFVLARGESRLRDLRRASRDARSMGAHVTGSVLVSKHRAVDSRAAGTDQQTSASSSFGDGVGLQSSSTPDYPSTRQGRG